jgi:GntR family transcriptional regulator
VSQRPLPAPLYQRVFGVIYQRIQTGQYQAGSALSTEDQLAAEFEVSKATIRQAVGELVERNLVVRRQGKGTFVRDDAALHLTPPFVGSFADLIIGTHDMSVSDESIERDATFPPDVIAALQMDRATGTILRHRRDIETTPFAYAVVYASPLVDRYLQPSEIRATRRITLLHERGMRITGARQSMSAERADADVARRLDVDFGVPVLLSERVTHSSEGPVEVAHTWYRGDLYKWEADLHYTWVGEEIGISVVT